MSTKAIHDALKSLKTKANAEGDDGAWNLALEAESELEAIRRVMKVLAKAEIFCGPSVADVTPSDFDAMNSTVSGIARETT